MLILTTLSLAAAAISGVIAWRLLRAERLRSAARVVGLEAAIDRDADISDDFEWEAPTSDSPVDEPHVSAPRVGSHAGPLLTAAALLVAGVIVIVLMAMLADRDGAPGVESSAQDELELLSMTHAREGSTLIVTGLVRNASHTETAPLTTVITAIDRDGQVVGSGTTPLPPVAAGRTRPFTVRIDNVNSIGRYRVSFRANGGVMPHVDRRGSRAAPAVVAE